MRTRCHWRAQRKGPRSHARGERGPSGRGLLRESEQEYLHISRGDQTLLFLEKILLKKLQYRNDVLVGSAIYYDSGGNISIEGNYKKGKKHGLWRYYKNGKVILEEIYPKPLKKAKK